VVIVGVVAVALSGLTACGGSDRSLTRDEFIAQMTSGDEAIPAEQATCIADGVESAGIKIDKDGNPSKDREDEATQIAIQCFSDATSVDPSATAGGESTSTTQGP
jgi:hypothetical protein